MENDKRRKTIQYIQEEIKKRKISPWRDFFPPKKGMLNHKDIVRINSYKYFMSQREVLHVLNNFFEDVQRYLYMGYDIHLHKVGKFYLKRMFPHPVRKAPHLDGCKEVDEYFSVRFRVSDGLRRPVKSVTKGWCTNNKNYWERLFADYDKQYAEKDR